MRYKVHRGPVSCCCSENTRVQNCDREGAGRSSPQPVALPACSRAVPKDAVIAMFLPITGYTTAHEQLFQKYGDLSSGSESVSYKIRPRADSNFDPDLGETDNFVFVSHSARHKTRERLLSPIC